MYNILFHKHPWITSILSWLTVLFTKMVNFAPNVQVMTTYIAFIVVIISGISAIKKFFSSKKDE